MSPHSFWTKEEGSATLESAVVFPVVFLITLGIMLFSVYLFERTQLSGDAFVGAERISANWDNSYKEFGTGSFPPERNDGLYWRISGDGITGLLGIGGESVSAGNAAGTAAGGNDLMQKKLGKAAGAFINTQLTSRYMNKGVERKITVDAGKSIKQPKEFSQLHIQKEMKAGAFSYVVEPAEFLRNVDLLQTYYARLKGYFDHDGKTSAFKENAEDQPPLQIHSEAEAKAYIQALVGGRAVVFETETVGESRQIDALDSDGIAHEAKYTVNDKDAREQIDKEVELIKRGLIKGSVWHFFRHAKKGTISLSPSLRAYLEKNGIVIVIHN